MRYMDEEIVSPKRADKVKGVKPQPSAGEPLTEVGEVYSLVTNFLVG